MKTTVSFSDFRDAFRAYDRLDNFSYEGARALFDYLEEIEQSCGEEIELDVIALCCDYSEASVEQIADGYNLDLTDNDCNDTLTDEEKAEIVRDYLNDNTVIVGEVAGGFVYADF